MLIGINGTVAPTALNGTAGDDTIIGTIVDDLINGGDGNDILYGGSGNDTLNGDNGRDYLRGDDGDDVLNGGAGNDWLQGYAGNDILNGGDGNDQLDGFEGNDILDGGAGDDQLNGDAGSDTYLFGRGSGHDRVYDTGDVGAVKEDIIQLGQGITAADIALSIESSHVDDLVISINGTSDKLDVIDYFSGSFPSTVGIIRFFDGTTLDYAAVKANLTIKGTSGNDTVRGYDSNDILDGGAGNDVLIGGAGNDTYLFGRGDGQDVINTDYSTDSGKLNTVQFKAGVLTGDVVVSRSNFGVGDDLILATAGTTDSVTVRSFFLGDDFNNPYNPIQQVKFADGTIWNIGTIRDKAFAGTAGDDVIRGTITDDLINGQAGHDNLNGGDGNDTLNGGAVYDDLHGDGGNDILNGDDGDDVLWGDDGNDTLNGGAGNDNLYGGAGDDTLGGGAGNDILIGGAGNDTYLFGRGDGQDVINTDYSTDPGKLNTVQFKTGVLSKDIIITSRGYGDVEFSIAGTSDSIFIHDFFSDLAVTGTIQQVKFADGTIWDYSLIRDKIFMGTSGKDNISGTAADDLFRGGADVDTLDGGLGNDTLDGGSGNDYLNGGSGNDTYLFGRGDGQDVITSGYSTGELDTLQFQTGVLADDIEAGRSNSDLILAIAGTTDKVTLSSFFFRDNGQKLVVKFADGTIWGADAIRDKIFAGTSGNDSILGTAADDSIHGQAGDDTLSGNDGNDTLDGGAGIDSMIGGAGDDVYYVDNPGDIVRENSGQGVDTVVSSVSYALDYGVEKLILTGTIAIKGTGDSTDNAIIGNQRANILDGAWGNDTLDGGEGTDTLIGGDGDDTYIVDISVNGVLQDAVKQTFSISRGTDTLQLRGNLTGTKAVTLTLASNLENLNAGNLTGATLLNLNGNNLANVLTGNAAANILNGNGGADTLIGGKGDDTYIVNSLQDVVTENQDEGIDLVNVGIAGAGGTYTLSANVENAILTGKAAYNLLGNTLNNILTGNAAANLLSGGLGDDTLAGNGGNDTLTGGAGKDVFVLNTALKNNIDSITDFVHGEDSLQLDTSVFAKLRPFLATGVGGHFVTGGSAVKALDADDYLLYDNQGGKLYYDADGSGKAAAIQFATLTSLPVTLGATDFVLVP